MTPSERVGELLMVGMSPDQLGGQTRWLISNAHVGSVFLTYRSVGDAVAVRAAVKAAQQAATPSGSLIVATDQEGGKVQRLGPPGFARIPSATEQDRLATTTLESDATRWGRQLAGVGVNLDLAPVLDVVPGKAARNAPIGALRRNYGSTPEAVSQATLVVINGLAAGGVQACGKHFPGLGEVIRNTDFASNVTDRKTTANSALLNTYQNAIDHNIGFMMVSTATYSLIDPGVPAALSRRIVTGLLRNTMDFTGVVVSDDLGNAAQMAKISPGDRAVRFISAGGDLIVTADLNDAPLMASALESAQTNPAFARLVTAADMRIVEAKLRMGLLK